MAALAFGLDVLATQRVFCVAVMVEACDGPVLFGVAALALGAELAFVFVVFLVTGDASRRCALEFGIGVAVLADDITVFSGQREFRFAVIEKGFLPVAFLVTVGAQGAQTALVFVVLLVARKAVRWRIAEPDLRLVAIAARNFRDRMPALEHAGRAPMVERL